MVKTFSLRIAALTLIAFIGFAGLFAATSHAKDKAKPASKLLVLKDDMKIDDCSARGIGDNVLFIYSRYCPHCKKAMPVVEEIVTAQKVGSRYLPIDVSTEEGRGLMKEYGITVQYVPTLVKDCTAHVGAKKKTEYQKILSNKGS